MTIEDWLKKNTSTILTCLGAGGVVATVALAIKATPKALDKIQCAQVDKGEEILHKLREGALEKSDTGYILPKLTAIETLQACWKEYLPTIAVGTGSLICIFGANVLSRRQQASLASAYAALESAYQGYRRKVCSILGPDTDAMIEKAVEQEKQDIEDDLPPWDEVQTFYLPCCGKAAFFERTMEEVVQAEYHINRNLVLRGEVTLNEFLSFLGLDAVEEACK